MSEAYKLVHRIYDDTAQPVIHFYNNWYELRGNSIVFLSKEKKTLHTLCYKSMKLHPGCDVLVCLFLVVEYVYPVPENTLSLQNTTDTPSLHSTLMW